MKRLDKLKNDYDKIDIPPELDDVVKNSIRQSKMTQKKRPLLKQWSIGAVAAASLFISSINISPAMAQSMANIPVLGAIVDVFTVQKLNLDEKTYQADLDTPAIDGLGNEGLENSLNEKYIEDSTADFDQFEEEVDEMKKAGDGHLGIDTGYEVMTDTDRILSIYFSFNEFSSPSFPKPSMAGVSRSA